MVNQDVYTKTGMFSLPALPSVTPLHLGSH